MYPCTCLRISVETQNFASLRYERNNAKKIQTVHLEKNVFS